MPLNNGTKATTMSPLQELASYAAAGKIERTEEYLRLARLCVEQAAAEIDTSEDLGFGAKWKLLRERLVGLDPITRRLADAEEAYVEELEDAKRGRYQPASEGEAVNA